MRVTSGLLSSLTAAHRRIMQSAPPTVYRQPESYSLPLADISHRCRRPPNLKQSDCSRGTGGGANPPSPSPPAYPRADLLDREFVCRPCRTDTARRTVFKHRLLISLFSLCILTYIRIKFTIEKCLKKIQINKMQFRVK